MLITIIKTKIITMIQSFPVIIIVPLSFIVTIIRKITIIIIVIVIKSTSYP